jgi:hypothetical protein
MKFDINSLLFVPFEDWPKHGIHLRAVSANADGHVNSGLIGGRSRYLRNRWISRVWDFDFQTMQHSNPHFVVESTK